MAARKVLTGVAVLALGGGVLASVANAAPLCGSKACSDEAAASGLPGDAGRACLKSLISDCQAGLPVLLLPSLLVLLLAAPVPARFAGWRGDPVSEDSVLHGRIS
jgi:hypothetical protein